MAPLSPLTLLSADVPLLLSIPHAGRALPQEVVPRLADGAITGLDTDWHLDRLLNIAPALGVGVAAFQVSRIIVDVDQPAGSPALCPHMSHGGVPFYLPGQQPSSNEIDQRRATLWQAYHDGVAVALRAMQQRFGLAVLIDVHSVRSTHHGGADISVQASPATSAPSLLGRVTDGLAQLCARADLATRLDTHAQTGFTLQHHARPTLGVHALRLNLSQDLYMEEAPPFRFRRDLAVRLEPMLIGLIRHVLDWVQLQNATAPARPMAYSPA
jgi:N-formylglutamate deformylase